MSSIKATNPESTKKIKTALKKAIGSIQKTLELLDEQPECGELLVQIDSAIGSLESGRRQIVDYSLDNCLQQSLKEGNQEKLKRQIMRLYKLQK